MVARRMTLGRPLLGTLLQVEGGVDLLLGEAGAGARGGMVEEGS